MPGLQYNSSGKRRMVDGTSASSVCREDVLIWDVPKKSPIIHHLWFKTRLSQSVVALHRLGITLSRINIAGCFLLKRRNKLREQTHFWEVNSSFPPISGIESGFGVCPGCFDCGYHGKSRGHCTGWAVFLKTNHSISYPPWGLLRHGSGVKPVPEGVQVPSR